MSGGRPADMEEDQMDDRMRRAALYIRVSTMHQVDKDSLPVQMNELINFCKYVLGIESYVVFEDAGFSAKNTNRPQYQQMLSRMRQGEFTHLVVWKIDRISRNLLDFATMYAELKELDVTFVSKNEQFDTSSPIGEAMLKIILIFAELERKMTAERVSAVMLSRATEGKWNGGRIAFGYEYERDSGVFSMIDEEIKIVQLIFDTYEAVRSTLAVAKMLNAKGLRTRSGAEWSTVAVWLILTNPFYYGALRYNYRNESKGPNEWSFRSDDEIILIPGHHQAAITKDQFDRCNAILEGRGSGKHDMPRTRRRKNTHVFAGLIRCGCCGAYYNATISKANAKGERQSIYMCSTRAKKGSSCTNKFITDNTAGTFVMNYISNMIRAKESFGRSTSMEVLEKKLLRGSAFAEVDHIERNGLEELYALLREEKYGIGAYEPPELDDGMSAEENERAMLDKEKRKIERALSRLNSLFLYDESGMAETDFIIERKRLMDQLEQIDDRIQALDDRAVQSMNMSDAEFIAKATMFALNQELHSKREIDYHRFIKATDPEITKDFVATVCTNFCVLDGRIMSIRFRNGIEHRFVYKKSEPV